MLTEGLSGGRLYLALAGVALIIAALSLLIPSTPSYDPWAWLVWGREIVHLNLHTTGGPTWKPLPVIFTTLFAPFGKAAPDMWLVVARAGALVAVAMTFKLGWRLMRALGSVVHPPAADGNGAVSPEARVLARASELAAPLLAAILAAGSLVVSSGFISDNALGYSEGFMTAAVLVALDRHLDGERRQAFAVGFIAALDRPEIWLYWGLYGLYLFWKDPGARRLVAGMFALIPVFWFLPELWGSGHLFRGVSRAQHVRSNSAANASCPFCTELAQHAWKHALLRVKVVTGIVLAVSGVLLLRQRHSLLSAARGEGPIRDARLRAILHLFVVGALGASWWLLIAVMTQAGFSGNDRYLVLGAALIVIAGGVGWAWGGQSVGDLIKRSTAPAQGIVGALAAAVVFMALPPWIGSNVVDLPRTHRALAYQADLRNDLSAVIRKAGGSAAILRCGSVMTEGFQVPMVAWNLGVHTIRIEASPQSRPLPPAPNVIFQTRAQRSSHLLPILHDWPGAHYTLVAHVRTFRLYANCSSLVAR
jgi:hypothetical protein